MAEQWRNPPKFFLNPLYDAEKAARKTSMNKYIKEALDKYHRELKHESNDLYYDMMDHYEGVLKARFDENYNRNPL